MYLPQYKILNTKNSSGVYCGFVKEHFEKSNGISSFLNSNASKSKLWKFPFGSISLNFFKISEALFLISLWFKGAGSISSPVLFNNILKFYSFLFYNKN